jgi:hypothetical protein
MIRVCIKCSHDKSKVFYCVGILERGCPAELRYVGSKGLSTEEIKQREHLHCKCEVCGYKWAIKCADTKEA